MKIGMIGAGNVGTGLARHLIQHPSLPEAVWINPPAPNKENTS